MTADHLQLAAIIVGLLVTFATTVGAAYKGRADLDNLRNTVEENRRQAARDIERIDNAMKTVPERLARIETLLEMILKREESRP